MTAISNIEEALSALGASEDLLNADEIKCLDENGYLILERVLTDDQVKQYQDKYEYLMNKEGQGAGLEVHQEEGTRRLSDLPNKGDLFDMIYTHPKVLAAVYHVIRGEFKLSSLNARDALPGQGAQGFHADWQPRKEGEPFIVVNSVWMIDDFTPYNGATRVLPGSHLLINQKPSDIMPNPADSHPDQQLLLGPAGSVGIFIAHTFHGGTLNVSQSTRRAFHCYYCARGYQQQLNQREYIRKQTYDRISPAARYILDVD